MTPTPLSTKDRLARFLLGIGEPPEAEVMRTARLAAYAYSALAPDHPSRAALRSDYLAALARHQRLKGELMPLLTAWREAGIEALLFKGFYLAEFIYPLPGALSRRCRPGATGGGSAGGSARRERARMARRAGAGR